MNKKENPRYQDVRRRIEGAMLELLEQKTTDQITVSELCREAKIHRTTFYGHYKDIPNLLDRMAGEMYHEVMRNFFLEEDGAEGEGFLQLFYYIKEHRQLFKSLMDYYASGKYDFNFVPPSLKAHVEKLTEKMQYEDKEEVYYYHIFFSEGVKAMIYRWLKRDCKESPELMQKVVMREYR